MRPRRASVNGVVNPSLPSTSPSPLCPFSTDAVRVSDPVTQVPSRRKRAVGYWKSPENSRAFMLELGQKLGFNPEDYAAWYKVTNQILLQNGGSVVLVSHNSSMVNLLRAVFPEHTWEESKFSKKPQGYWKSLDNQRRYVDEIGEKLGIPKGEYEKWYEFDTISFKREGGRGLLTQHNSSLAELLKAVYPEHTWEDSRFLSRPRNFWKSEKNQRQFLDEVGLKLGIQPGEYEKWYKFTSRDIIDHGGKGALTGRSTTLAKMLQYVYPEHKWDLSKFAKKPQNFWDGVVNQKRKMEEIAAKFGFGAADLSGWYSVTSDDFIKAGGNVLLQHHGSSISKLLKTIYPGHKWNIDRFTMKPRNYWNHEQQRSFMDGLGVKLGIQAQDLSGWYKVSQREVVRNGGASILYLHNSSLLDLLAAVYPEHKWDPSKFEYKPRGHWSDMANQRAFMVALGQKMGFKDGDYEPWYKVIGQDIVDQGGVGLLPYHNYSVVALLQSVFPEHKFDPLKFSRPSYMGNESRSNRLTDLL